MFCFEKRRIVMKLSAHLYGSILIEPASFFHVRVECIFYCFHIVAWILHT